MDHVWRAVLADIPTNKQTGARVRSCWLAYPRVHLLYIGTVTCYQCSTVVVRSCMLLLASLLNFAGFSTAAAVIPEGVNAVVGLLACCCRLSFHYFCKRFLLLLASMYCVGCPVVAFIPAVACVLAVVGGHSITLSTLLLLFCWRHYCCFRYCSC
jgi:hypothetical protein